MLSADIIDSLFPAGLPGPENWEDRYPPRDLPQGAQVTRFSPSPTGFLHIGGVYAATIDVDVAHHSGGRYLVRLEDTDQARVVEGAVAQFAEAFAYFSIEPDEEEENGHYGRTLSPPARRPTSPTPASCCARTWRTRASRRKRSSPTSPRASGQPAPCPATTGNGRSGATPIRTR
jgi:hypothetical protein